MNQPKVTLLSWTKNPIGTIYSVWQAARLHGPAAIIPSEVEEDSPEVLEVFKKVIDTKLPVAENLDFVFLLENVSISFREQMVRHRIGVKVGEQLGVDFVPDLQDSSWWSQGMRILDMSTFAKEERYRLPQTVIDKGEDVVLTYTEAMRKIQDAYVSLLKAGVPIEDCREVLPMGVTHRISWKLNLAALQHILGKRGCWITQLGLWEPIIKGMINEMATKIHPHFRTLIYPPCIKDGKFNKCSFMTINEDRETKKDGEYLPPCSLYLGMHKEKPAPAVAKAIEDFGHTFTKMSDSYRELWQKNPYMWTDIEGVQK